MKRIVILTLTLILLANCTTLELVKTVATSIYKHTAKNKYAGHYKVGNPYRVSGKWYYPKVENSYNKVGMASWYGDAFDTKLTANGEMFDKNDISAAHKTLPLPSMVRVTNLENNKSMLVRVNDRGPYVNDRIIDLSEETARKLGVYKKGTAKVRVQFDERATNKMFVHSSHKHFKRPRAHRESNGGTKVADLLNFKNKYKKSRKKSSSGNGLFVQSGAYSSHATARAIAEDLKNVARVVIQEVIVRGKNIFRVRLGPFTTEEQADKVIIEAEDLGYYDAVIIK